MGKAARAVPWSGMAGNSPVVKAGGAQITRGTEPMTVGAAARIWAGAGAARRTHREAARRAFAFLMTDIIPGAARRNLQPKDPPAERQWS